MHCSKFSSWWTVAFVLAFFGFLWVFLVFLISNFREIFWKFVFSIESFSAQGLFMPKEFSSFSKQWSEEAPSSYLIWFFSEHTQLHQFRYWLHCLKWPCLQAFYCCCCCSLKTEKPKIVICVTKLPLQHDIHCCKTTHDSNNSD